MSAQEQKGASRATLDDALAALQGHNASIDPTLAPVREFLERLKGYAKPLELPTDSDGFRLEAALQSGFDCIDDDIELYAVAGTDLVKFVRDRDDWARGVREGLEAALEDKRRLVRELDVALNGEAGAAKQASLCDLVAQVRAQQAVQILNLSDGMRVNFRAPDGRRGTLRLDNLLTNWCINATDSELELVDTMRAAIEAYPVAGDPIPVEVPQ